MYDEEEFEGVEAVKKAPVPEKPKVEEKKEGGGKAKAASMPRKRKELHEFYPEIGALVFLAIYGLNYLYGRRVNQSLAERWLATCSEVLEENFALVGADNTAKLVTDSADQLYLYCSGRLNCESCMITLDLRPRQDLFAALWALLAGSTANAASDTVTLEVMMGSTAETGGNMDKYCLAICQKHEEGLTRSTSKDLQGTALRKWKTQLHDSLMCMSEEEEVARDLLPEVVVPTLNENRQYIKLIHFSDRLQVGATRRERAALKFVFQLLPVHRHPAKDGGKDKTEEEKLRVGEILLRIALRYVDKVATYQVGHAARERIKKALQLQAEAEFKKTRTQREAEAQQRKLNKLQQEKASIESMSPAARAKYEEKLEKKKRKEAAPVKSVKIK